VSDPFDDRALLLGISAVLLPGDDLDSAVLDLAAVLEGLVADRFEIIVVSRDVLSVADVRARAPGLPLRVVAGETFADGCAVASFNLIFVSAPDGQFDVRQINHLLEAIEDGADVAVGYRPRRRDAFFRKLQRWGWHVDLDCAFALIRRGVWTHVVSRETSCARGFSRARKRGYQVTEIPVSARRPTIGAPIQAGSRAA
jgi:hypothetical protein